MSKPKAPGDIPEWAIDYTAMSLSVRMEIAIAVGVSERTASNWAKGIGAPNKASKEALLKALYRPRKPTVLRVVKRMGGRA